MAKEFVKKLRDLGACSEKELRFLTPVILLALLSGGCRPPTEALKSYTMEDVTLDEWQQVIPISTATGLPAVYPLLVNYETGEMRWRMSPVDVGKWNLNIAFFDDPNYSPAIQDFAKAWLSPSANMEHFVIFAKSWKGE